MNLGQHEAARPAAARRPGQGHRTDSWNFPEHEELLQVPSVLNPEERLVLGILEEAVSDAHRFAKDGFQYRPETVRGFGERRDWAILKAWVAGAPARFTFAQCCDVLDLDPDYLRRGFGKIFARFGRGVSPAVVRVPQRRRRVR